MLVAEVKKHLGRLELETEALAEMLLQAYYVLHGHATAAVGNSCLFCLCDFTTFHYFRLPSYSHCNCLLCTCIAVVLCDTG